jgi:DNA-binding NarL/FixJ family response regulator
MTINGFHKKAIMLMSEGKRDNQIARELGMPTYRIKYNLDQLKQFWGCKNRTHLVAAALRKKIIE